MRHIVCSTAFYQNGNCGWRLRMKKFLLLLLLLSFSSLAFASPITFTINFEQYPEYTQITNQYTAKDATFTNVLQLVVPGYDSFDYPPHSGSGVITNDPSDPITVNFSVLMYHVSFWYAAPGGIVVTGSNGDVIHGADVSGTNAQITVPGAVTSITISANLGADSVTVDDLTYSVVP